MPFNADENEYEDFVGAGDPTTFDISDVAAIAQRLREADSRWKPGRSIQLGDGLSWRPHLQRGSDRLIIHVTARLMPYAGDRLRAARASGSKIHIAMPLANLYDEELLLGTVDLEPMVHLIAADGSIDSPRPLLQIVGDQVRVTPSARTALASRAWDLARSAIDANAKGHRLEDLLCFLFGQVQDFEVSDVRLRTATEELDLVLTVRATAGRCWVLPGAPLILVEAKNWHTASVGQPEISEFAFQASHKHGTVRIGIMVAANGFSPEARMQTLRTASEDVTIVLVGPDELNRWITALDGDKTLEDVVRGAMLY